MTEVDPALQRQVAEIVHAAANGDNEDSCTGLILGLISSVHENAKGYGRLLGEESVLDAVLLGRIKDQAMQTWSNETKRRLNLAGVA